MFPCVHPHAASPASPTFPKAALKYRLYQLHVPIINHVFPGELVLYIPTIPTQIPTTTVPTAAIRACNAQVARLLAAFREFKRRETVGLAFYYANKLAALEVGCSLQGRGMGYVNGKSRRSSLPDLKCLNASAYMLTGKYATSGFPQLYVVNNYNMPPQGTSYD